VIHGEEDSLAPVEQAVEIFHFVSPNKRLLTYQEPGITTSCIWGSGNISRPSAVLSPGTQHNELLLHDSWNIRSKCQELILNRWGGKAQLAVFALIVLRKLFPGDNYR
jgi:hypothetical protein